jgi:hypothetical protein
MSIVWHTVVGSAFATLSDLAAFKRAKAAGKSDQEAFKVGDNGIGCWGDATAQTQTPMVALPPETMIARWGSVAAAKHKGVLVRRGNVQVSAILADRMPHIKNITNGARIDLNPAVLTAFKLGENTLATVQWAWADGEA